MKGKIVVKNGSFTPNGREEIMEVRKGAKGTGAVVGETRYWPWSEKSCEAADRIVSEIAARAGIELVPDWQE